MAQELVYTSTPRGLRLGSSGFCTIACTRGMAPNYIETLESLSGYTPVFRPNHPQANANPLAFSHYRFTIGGKPVSMLSRVAAAGVDYTKRPNKFAHHLVLDVRERSAGGPAWVMRQPGVFLEQWEGDPQFLDQPRRIPAGDSSLAPCQAWQAQLGDAGWAGVLAQAFLEDPDRPAFIIFKPGVSVLALIDEALRLLPVDRRWDVTFSTYFMSLPARTTCAWRCCLAGSRVLKQARRMPDALILDLEAGIEQPAVARRKMQESSSFIAYARTGAPPHAPPYGTPAAKQRRNERPLALAAEGTIANSADGAHPRSPGDVWLESARSETKPKSTKGLKIALYALMAVLLISLLANAFLLLKRHKSLAAETQGDSASEENQKLAQEVADLQSTIDKLTAKKNQIEDEKRGLKDGLHSANAALKGLGEKNKDLEGELATTKKEVDRITKELNNLRKAQNPSAIACLGQLEGMDLNSNLEYKLPVDGLSENGKVTGVGWWKEVDTIAQNEIDAIKQNEIEPAGNALVIFVPDPNYDEKMIRCVEISTSDKAVLFKKVPKTSLTPEKMQKLMNIGWIELELDGNQLIVFTRRRPLGSILLRQDTHNVLRFGGSVEVEPVLLKKGVMSTWSPAEGVKQWSVPKKVSSGELGFSATFEENDQHIIRQALNHPLELHCDGQTIASFKLGIK